MIPFHNPVGILDDVQIHPHDLLPDHLLLRVSWTNKQMELAEGRLELREAPDPQTEERMFVLDRQDVVRLHALLQSFPS